MKSLTHILRRPKDVSRRIKNALGANETQRLIRTYYIDSIEYLDKKKEAIKELCRSNNARAYINVQPKDNFECLLNLGEKIFETIRNKNYSVKPEHLIRQAYCEWHKTRKKQWILDLDHDQMVEHFVQNDHGTKKLCTREWTVEAVKDLVKRHLMLVGKNPDDMWSVVTRNGCHVICPPFNLIEAQKECSLIFEGERKVQYDVDVGPGEYETCSKKQVGWLHKDGLTLLYMDTDCTK